MPQVTLSTGISFRSEGTISLLEAATKAGVPLPYSCKTGRCITCKCKVISGETVTLLPETGLTDANKAEGWILSCVRTATTDVKLDVESLGDVVIPFAKTLPCRINHLEKLAPDVLKVILRMPPNAIFDFIPGQYIDVIGTSGARRSYSLANAPNKDKTLELHIRAIDGGIMSQYWFNEARLNDLLRFHGPQGTFFMREVAERDLVFLATGTGIAPVKAILEALPKLPKHKRPKSITVLWGARQAKDLYMDVSNLLNDCQNQYIPVLSRAGSNWEGARGYIQDVLIDLKPNLSGHVIYACGSDAMIKSAKAKLTAAGLPERQFYSDAFVCSATSNQ